MEPKYAAEAFAGETVEISSHDEPVTFETATIGEIVLPTGRLVAWDPLVLEDAQPFTREVPTGRFPVEVALANLDDGQRIAFARIRFSDQPAVRWEAALLPGQHPSLLEDDEIYGFPVDSGAASFMDERALAALAARIDRDDHYLHGIADEMTNDDDWSKIELRPDPAEEANVIAFSVGDDGGIYPTSFGFAADGSLVAVITDFCVADSGVDWVDSFDDLA